MTKEAITKPSGMSCVTKQLEISVIFKQNRKDETSYHLGNPHSLIHEIDGRMLDPSICVRPLPDDSGPSNLTNRSANPESCQFGKCRLTT